MKRLLFVDDEQSILDGLKRSLRGMRHHWQMDFVSSGEQGVQQLAQQSYDLVVSDMRMPGMNGAEFLEKVSELCPDAIRFILSGYADEEMSLRTAVTAHQFLVKPCDVDSLVETVNRAFQLSDSLGDARLHSFVNSLKTLPSLPEPYQQLIQALSSPDAGVEEIAGILSSDPAMSAKILQMVNSAFFGLGREISNVSEAARLIGFDSIRSLALSVGIFSQFEAAGDARINFSKMHQHYLKVALLAERIARSMGQSKLFIEDCFLAGMVHDIGILIMHQNNPQQFAQVLELSRAEQIDRVSAETRVFGFNHGLVGAYLLGIWGLRHNVVEAVAYHHMPNQLENNQFSVATALHVADTLADERDSADNEKWMEGQGVDSEYLQRLGLLEHLDEWRKLNEETSDE